MERPNHLHTADQSTTSRVTGLAVVIGIHVLVVLGLITALASGQIMKQIQNIQATVEREKTPPKAPPPPPPDLVKPPPPVAIVPDFQVAAEAPPPVQVAPKAPPAPPPKVVSTAPSATELKQIARTHTQPAYPTISQRLGEQGTSHLMVKVGLQGNATECSVTKSSGSDRLDQAACEWIKAHWRWQPPTHEGQPMEISTPVDIVWNLKDAQ